MEEVPEEAIQEAEAETGATVDAEAGPVPGRHDHEGVTGEDDTLRTHLEDIHGLEVPLRMSSSTQAGLHDRLHDDTGAADD